jgi:hypothetical protein
MFAVPKTVIGDAWRPVEARRKGSTADRGYKTLSLRRKNAGAVQQRHGGDRKNVEPVVEIHAILADAPAIDSNEIWEYA